jgi:hypothetical protein
MAGIKLIKETNPRNYLDEWRVTVVRWMSLRSLLNGTSFTRSSLSLFIENSGILVN